jgi:hypothetical protein
MACSGFGFTSLYATLVYVACGQLEKLRATLLDIRQTNVPSEQDISAGAGQHECHASEDIFRHMQKQLNDCIRHHQEIQRCVYN